MAIETTTTTASRERVTALRAEAAAKVAETTALFASLTPAQAAVRTEIGWTVAATAAHLALATGFAAVTVRDLRRGKVPNIPMPVLNAANYVYTRVAARKPLDKSVPHLRDGIARALLLLDDWTDADLDVRFTKPFLFNPETHGKALHNALIGHQDMHVGQVRRALGTDEGR